MLKITFKPEVISGYESQEPVEFYTDRYQVAGGSLYVYDHDNVVMAEFPIEEILTYGAA